MSTERSEVDMIFLVLTIHYVYLLTIWHSYNSNQKLFIDMNMKVRVPLEFREITGEYVTTSAKTSLQFPFDSHSHIFDILCVYTLVVWIYKVSLVNYDFMWVNTTVDVTNVGIRTPSVRHNLRAR